MRVLILDTNYLEFNTEFWATHPELESQTYARNWRALMDECFGTADYYSHNLAKIGIEATEVIANDERLQRLWAREHGVALPGERMKWKWVRRRKLVPWLSHARSQHWVYAALEAQIEAFSPDVLYVQDTNFADTNWLQHIKKRGILVAGQVAWLLQHSDYSVYDVIFTSLPRFLPELEKRGARAHYFRIGFEPRVLGKLGQSFELSPRFEVGFGGGISREHSQRTRFLESIARAVPLDVWGYGAEHLAATSPLRARHHGRAWGLEMYRVLQNCGIVINGHINIAGPDANNMRLYETTGVGALLLTDNKRNLGELFEIDKEIVAYENADDCAEKIKWLLNNPNQRHEIARAGQARTLREHTYARRMEELAIMLNNV